MRELVSWLRELREEIQNSTSQDPALLDNTYKRVAYPRIEPLHGPGFLRFQGLEHYHRPGHGPESLSLIQTVQAKREQDPGIGEEDALNRQIGAVLALSLDRSVEVPSERPYPLSGSTRTAFIPLNAAHDRILHAPISDVDDVNLKFEEVAGKFCSIEDSGDLVALGAATEMHYGACSIYKTSMPSAYVLAVGALETLSARFGDPHSEWSHWEQSTRWDEVIDDLALNSAQAESIRAELMRDRQVRLGQRFAAYVMQGFESRDWLSNWKEWTWGYDGSTGDPNGGEWTAVDMNPQIPSDEGRLWRAIKKTYEARSKFVHSGSDDLAIHRDMQRQVQNNEGAQALPFTVIRALLARSILRELDELSSPEALPRVSGEL